MSGSPAFLPKPRLPFFILAAALLLADQWSKQWVLENFMIAQRRTIVPGWLDFTFVRNDGIAFGLFQGNNIAMMLLVLVILLFGAWWSTQFDWKKLEVNIVGGAILAGAAGNLIDRVRHGFVVDFIDVNLQFTRWPAFNIADSAISLSMTWILLRIFLDSLPSRQTTRDPDQ